MIGCLKEVQLEIYNHKKQIENYYVHILPISIRFIVDHMISMVLYPFGKVFNFIDLQLDGLCLQALRKSIKH